MLDLVEKRKAQEASGTDISSLGAPELVYGYNDRYGGACKPALSCLSVPVH